MHFQSLPLISLLPRIVLHIMTVELLKGKTRFHVPQGKFSSPLTLNEQVLTVLFRCTVSVEFGPYICTHKDCRDTIRMFSARADWREHMTSCHSEGVFDIKTCPFCGYVFEFEARELWILNTISIRISDHIGEHLLSLYGQLRSISTDFAKRGQKGNDNQEEEEEVEEEAEDDDSVSFDDSLNVFRSSRSDHSLMLDDTWIVPHEVEHDSSVSSKLQNRKNYEAPIVNEEKWNAICEHMRQATEYNPEEDQVLRSFIGFQADYQQAER